MACQRNERVAWVGLVRRGLPILLAALAVAPAARAGGPYMLVGAADDVVLGRDAPAKLQLAKLAGLDSVRVTAQWTRGQTALPEAAQAGLEEAVAAAKLAGIRIVVSIYPYGSSQTPIAEADRADFAQYAASIAKSDLYLHDFIVGNEPNLNRFWLPQFGPSGEDAAAVAYTGLLAETYDAIKSVRPRTTVYGGALAPRGSDRPNTARDTHSPTAFIADMGAAYRALGRTTPIMDAFAFHPYADASNVPPTAAHPNSTSIGIADYDKLVSLLGTAFDGTGQRGSTLPILYDEFGVEALVPAAKESLYTGTEATTVHPVDEATQAQFYNQALQLSFCQKNVIGLLLFHFVDEPGHAGWQSGVYYADGTPKTSIGLVRNAADATRRGIVAQCNDLKATPKLTVSASATKVLLTSTLDAGYTLTLQRFGGKAPKVVLAGSALGRRTTTVRVTQKLPKGRYRWKLTAKATENAGPPGLAFSKAFRVA
jgi:hypothetical protein